MKLIGKTRPGGTSFELGSDAKRVARSTFAVGVRVVKLTLYVDGQGSGVGSQVMRGVIYDSSGNRIAQGDEVVVTDGQAAGWVDLPFTAYPGGVTVGPGSYDLGVIAGANNHTARVYGDALTSNSRTAADTYSDGAASTFGTATTANFDMAVFATYTTLLQVLPAEDDLYYARLPFDRAQAALDTSKTDPSTLTITDLSWHGDLADPERGSFVLVKRDGPLDGLVGERVQIIAGRGTDVQRRVVAYCHADADLISDISATRRLFLALGILGDDTATVEVEVLV